MVHSERYFENPLKFDPERWVREKEGLEEIDPFTILSFGFGARMCIGRRTAEQEMYLTLIKVNYFYLFTKLVEVFYNFMFV